MKRIAAILMALIMALSLSVTVLAADTIETVDSPLNVSTGSVVVTLTEGDKPVYSVTVDWTETAMKYTAEGEGVWQPESHTYAEATENRWIDNVATVTVTNHSNAGVTAKIAPGTNVTGASYSFDKTSFELARATAGTEQNEAPANTFTITADENRAPRISGTDTFKVTIWELN